MKANNFFKQTSWMIAGNQSQDSKKTNLLKGIKYFLKYTILSVILVVLIEQLCKACGIQLDNALYADEFKVQIKENFFLMLFMIGIWAPITEEIMFRFWQSYKRWHIATALFLITFFILGSILQDPSTEEASTFFTKSDIYLVPVKIIGSALVASQIFLLSQAKVTDFGKRYGTHLAWITVFVFTLLHVTNYSCPWYALPLAAMSCAPQFVFGTTATFYRRNLAFGYCIALHMLINTIFILISFMSI